MYQYLALTSLRDSHPLLTSHIRQPCYRQAVFFSLPYFRFHNSVSVLRFPFQPFPLCPYASAVSVQVDTSKLVLKNQSHHDVMSWTSSPLSQRHGKKQLIVIPGIEDSGRYTCVVCTDIVQLRVDTTSRPTKNDGSKFMLKFNIMALTPSPPQCHNDVIF